MGSEGRGEAMEVTIPVPPTVDPSLLRPLEVDRLLSRPATLSSQLAAAALPCQRAVAINVIAVTVLTQVQWLAAATRRRPQSHCRRPARRNHIGGSDPAGLDNIRLHRRCHSCCRRRRCIVVVGSGAVTGAGGGVVWVRARALAGGGGGAGGLLLDAQLLVLGPGGGPDPGEHGGGERRRGDLVLVHDLSGGGALAAAVEAQVAPLVHHVELASASAAAADDGEDRHLALLDPPHAAAVLDCALHLAPAAAAAAADALVVVDEEGVRAGGVAVLPHQRPRLAPRHVVLDNGGVAAAVERAREEVGGDDVGVGGVELERGKPGESREPEPPRLHARHRNPLLVLSHRRRRLCRR